MRLSGRIVFLILTLALACAACAQRGAEPSRPLSVAPGSPLAPDASCQAASDCVVKNVGNCCGYFPACVNKDAAVDPDAVRASCESSGMASVCGWKDIQACECVQNRCRAVDGPIAVDR